MKNGDGPYIKHLEIRNMKRIYSLIALTIVILSAFFISDFEAFKSYQEKNLMKPIDWEKLKDLSENDRKIELDVNLIEYYFDLTPEFKENNIPIILGRIDHKFLNELKKVSTDHDTIAVASTGGLSSYGEEAAKIILEKNINIIIFLSCTSACAEYLLPAANSVKFYDQPLIGFHGNAQSLYHYLIEQDVEIPCTIDKTLVTSWAEGHRELHIRTGQNPDFWREQAQRLIGPPKIINISETIGECIGLQKFKYDFWYPTSDELKSLLGLKFEGKICSDNQYCYEQKLPLFSDIGSISVVGGEIYITRIPH